MTLEVERLGELESTIDLLQDELARMRELRNSIYSVEMTHEVLSRKDGQIQVIANLDGRDKLLQLDENGREALRKVVLAWLEEHAEMLGAMLYMQIDGSTEGMAQFVAEKVQKMIDEGGEEE
jgi:hypothetical protein